ncbi:MAG TPA: tetratricopeptide repeat protein [Gemmatimonadales bacterium]|jgi:tetratricopeptide (TPR) repeat protein|nr:tetratricopeptide repeat protein [Gemmatimonadales bacterium]
MHTASLVVDKARQLAAAGHHAAVVEYLGARAGEELERSPSLALLYGTAQARLGHHDEGRRWLDVALRQARRRDEPAVERHALHARGAVALVSGRINEAADSFTQALAVASRDGDDAAVGRCSNNLGIISNLRGRHAEAIGSWELALAAFDRAGWRAGVAECHHNLAIAYREQGALERALSEADRAVAAADAAGDDTLRAMTLRGRAEVRLARGELEQARRALDEVREMRRLVPDAIGAAEDLRVGAALLVAEGDWAEAERALRDAIGRAEAHRRPQLLAEATRDLSALLRRTARTAQAETAARTAKAIFSRLGAEAEIRQLARQDWDASFAAELGAAVAPLHEAQVLADAGHYAELLAYLSERPQDELERSPLLTLLYGIAHGRLGRLDLGQHWAMVAQLRARLLRDRPLEVRALNVCGAIALERGGLNEATYFFTRAQEEAFVDNDLATVGRCANNLGIIATIQGDLERALGAYAHAITAYETAGCDRGVVESQHNLAITYREQGRLDDAMQSAAAALTGAERLGDRRLQAQALAGRAEIHVVRCEPDLAVRDVEQALVVHRELRDVVLETEDLRIQAGALGIGGKPDAARALLREVIDRATEHGRPLLVALAQRDLALLLVCAGEVAAAKEVARPARATFERLGARVEVEKLEALLAMSASRTSPPAVAPSIVALPPRDPSVPEQREGR